MTYQEITSALKDLYQTDPGAGSRWVETSDIEEAAGVAAVQGSAFIGAHRIEWSEGAGYSLRAG